MQKKNIKGVIVAAGYGTRFLPVTKTIPKEMLPLGTKPSIAWIVDEMQAAGIKEIIIISSRRKKCMEDYFDREMELESVFAREGAAAKAELIAPYKDLHISFIRQTEMLGTGHALLQVMPFLGDSAALVAYPDDIHAGSFPLAKQLIEAHEQHGGSVMATIHNPPNLERYGVLGLAEDGLHVSAMVEKPVPGTEPGKEVSIGRYLFTPEFFAALEEGWQKHCAEGKGGEYYHLYALRKEIEAGRVIHKAVEGDRLDTGEPAGLLQAQIQFAARDPELRKVLREEFRKLGLDKES